MASSKKEHRSRQRATAGRSSSLEPVQPIIIINEDQIKEEVKRSGVKEYVRVKERLRRNQERHGREHSDGWMDSDEKER